MDIYLNVTCGTGHYIFLLIQDIYPQWIQTFLTFLLFGLHYSSYCFVFISCLEIKKIVFFGLWEKDWLPSGWPVIIKVVQDCALSLWHQIHSRLMCRVWKVKLSADDQLIGWIFPGLWTNLLQYSHQRDGCLCVCREDVHLSLITV